MNKAYIHKVKINKELSSMRLDKILTKKLEKLSRMQIKTLIKSGNVNLNGLPILDPSYLVRENELDFSIDVDIEELDWVKLNQALIDVVYSKNGTGYRIQAGDLNLAGKSGTAQVVDINSREEYDEVRENLNLRDHAIFIGYAPFDDPRYSIAVIVENGESGGRVAGPIARDVLKELLDDI